jgi:hypothetical protein
VAQRLRQLSKRDPITKVKALQVSSMRNERACEYVAYLYSMPGDTAIALLCVLQALRVLVEERPREEIEGILLAWTKPFQRLVLDNCRCLHLTLELKDCPALCCFIIHSSRAQISCSKSHNAKNKFYELK